VFRFIQSEILLVPLLTTYGGMSCLTIWFYMGASCVVFG